MRHPSFRQRRKATPIHAAVLGLTSEQDVNYGEWRMFLHNSAMKLSVR